jgi:hypothetical protein
MPLQLVVVVVAVLQTKAAVVRAVLRGVGLLQIQLALLAQVPLALVVVVIHDTEISLQEVESVLQQVAF